MKLKIIFTVFTIFCFSEFASPNRNAADGKCACPAGKYQTGMNASCTGAQEQEPADFVPLAGMIDWL